jgi:hypothetical protein
MADYAYKERESEEAARAMRLEWLRDFAAVPPGQDRPLAEFTSRTHGTSQIVGYGKAAMVFLMLRDLIGRDAFDAGIKRFWQDYRFKTASWSALAKSFETSSQRDLSAFFAQWLNRQGAPSLQLDAAQRAGVDVRVKLVQPAPPYRLHVPLELRREQARDVHYAELDSESATFAFTLDSQSAEVALDPDFRLFRRLAAAEAPPILRQVMVDPATVTVLLGASAPALEAARMLAAKMQDEPPRLRAADERLGTAPLLVIGLTDEVDRWLQRHELTPRPAVLTKGSAAAWTIAAQGQTIAVVAARDASSLAALVRPLPHYGRRSYVVFEGDKAIKMGVWPAQPQARIIPSYILPQK